MDQLTVQEGGLQTKASAYNLLGEHHQTIVELDKLRTSLTIQLNDYLERMDELEARVQLITISKAIRILEAHLCLEVLGGSKTKFRKGNYNFNGISRKSDPKVTSELSRILAKHNLSEDHLNMMMYLKESGDSGAYATTKDGWIAALTSEDTQEASETTNDDEKQPAFAALRIKKDLLNVLEVYNPCPTDGGAWEIKHPVGF
jgi:hypothetical protein